MSNPIIVATNVWQGGIQWENTPEEKPMHFKKCSATSVDSKEQRQHCGYSDSP